MALHGFLKRLPMGCTVQYMHMHMDMTMNMCIIMFMNIYITIPNEEWLRKQSSMSGYINRLIEQDRGVWDGKNLTEEKMAEAIDKVVVPPVKLTTNETPPIWPGTIVRGDDLEQPCCKNATPCKHWSYDGVNSRWRNVLSLNIRPAEQF